MPKDKKSDDSEHVIDQLAANTKELLAKYYPQARIYRDDKDVIKIGVTHRVSTNEFGEFVANSVITFGKRIHDEVEHVIDTSSQFDFSDKTETESK